MRVNGSSRLSSVAQSAAPRASPKNCPHLGIFRFEQRRDNLLDCRQPKLSEPPAVRKSSQLVKHRTYCSDRKCSGPITAVACA
jgi:hypothetical protein